MAVIKRFETMALHAKQDMIATEHSVVVTENYVVIF